MQHSHRSAKGAWSEIIVLVVMIAEPGRGNTLDWPLALEQVREAKTLVPLQ